MSTTLNLKFFHLKYDDLIIIMRLLSAEYRGITEPNDIFDIVYGTSFPTGAVATCQDFALLNGYVAVTGALPAVLFQGEEGTWSTAVLDLPELSLSQHTEEMLYDLIRSKMAEKIGWWYTTQANKAILEQREAAGRLMLAKTKLPRRAGNPSMESVDVGIQLKL